MKAHAPRLGGYHYPMNKRSFGIIFTSMLLLCCAKEKMPGAPVTKLSAVEKRTVTDYVIKKGNHYCEQNQPEFINTPAIAAMVTFDSSAIYTTTDLFNQGDVNKLIGFSDCESQHHQNSARLGWSWNGKEVVMYAYVYANGVRIIKTLGAVSLQEAFACSVIAEKNTYYFKAAAYTDSIPRYCGTNSGYRYKLLPYFGGDETAPHEIRISIKEQ